MTNWVSPTFTSSRIKSAGKRLRDGTSNADDTTVLENWRASHAYVLNTFQTNLRRRSRGEQITVAQRLKRRPTILDKLTREPTMQLNTMHDIAGCRIIFQNELSLRKFRTALGQSRSEHTRKNTDPDRYDYILNPKVSGYRGVHDVYEYKVLSPYGMKWNGMHVELQFRTIYQHAWATAVEAADLVTSSRIKFSRAQHDYEDFFRHCSELIARKFENKKSCLPQISEKNLVRQFESLEIKTNLLQTLKNLRKSSNTIQMKTNTILIFRTVGGISDTPLEIRTFDTVNQAVFQYNFLEKELAGVADIVLVRAENAENIRDAFRNYFSDVHDFVQYIDDAISSYK